MFEGESIARQHSRDSLHRLERHRSNSAASRSSSQAVATSNNNAQPKLQGGQPMKKPLSRAVDAVPEEEHEDADHESSNNSTLAERDVEAAGGEKAPSGGDDEKPANKPQQQQEEDPFLVTIKGREHLNPHTWNVAYRWFLTGFAGLLVLNATFASSAPSNLIPSIIVYFGVSQEVGILLISVFVAGYCLGPLLWGPLSERYGRRIVFLVAWVPYIGFQVGAALSKNTASIIIFRFLGGTFAAAPLTNSGGVIADLWDADRRGDALAIFALMPFAGPAIAPIISGYLEFAGVSWRWIFWILTIFAGVCFVGIVFLLPETYVPYLLYKEAKRLRKETGDNRWHAQLETTAGRETPKDVLKRTVLKPFIIIVQEPMLLVITLYMSFVYGIVYLLFEAVPIIFIQQHGFNSGESGLVFLALLGGGVIAVMIYIFYFNPQYMKIHRSLKGKMVPPEERLRPLFYAAPIFAICFFWIGWTAYPSINVASPILGILFLGGCVLFIFLACFNYIIDTYLFNAASALSINTVFRSSLGAGFPLFAGQMYARLGTPGASSLLGGLAILFIPVPFVLYRYGKKIRSMSKNAYVFD
ncbi:hypothetical protein OIO90_002154 [Microbotryomycetes sp. JL221]|nr:hypothetical protein OIO90_002154 [Microbotryomycetes sp. JL221]